MTAHVQRRHAAHRVEHDARGESCWIEAPLDEQACCAAARGPCHRLREESIWAGIAAATRCRY